MIPPRSIHIREAAVGDTAWNDVIEYGRRLTGYAVHHDMQITAPIPDYRPDRLSHSYDQKWYISDELAGWLNLIEESR